jgi:succinylglutamic semialdehyde dehydrogenase
MSESGNFIGGNWVEGTGAAFQSLDPATGEVVWEGAASTAKDVEAALAAARTAFADWSSRSLEERIEVIRAFGTAADKRKEELGRVIARETGKVYWDALIESAALASKLDHSLRAYEERTSARSSTSGAIRSRLEHRPHGVMAVFGPYNFPAHLPNGHIVPALLAGNTVVLKPSELTPWSAEETLKLWLEAGLPEGVINLVQGARETGEALVQSPQIDGLLFTGSAATGAAISKALAARPEVILALELGGNNALLVDGTGDHEAAALLTIQSAFVTTGQRCTCARRLVVPKGAEGDGFLEVLAATMAGIRVGAWDDDPEPFMGPLISEGAANAVVAAQGGLERAGGRSIVKLEPLEQGSAFVSPGLIDVSAVNDRPDEEIFGPLLQVVRVGDFTAGLEEVNNTRYGLAAGILSADRSRYERFYESARAGVVNWNRPLTGASSAAPFGGLGISGNHRPSGYYAADYCAYPVASLETVSDQIEMADPPKGIDL